MNFDDDLYNFLYEEYKYNSNEVNGFSLSVDTGGASGGNCWGDRARPYDKSDSDIIDDINNYIIEKTKSYFNILNIEIEDSVFYRKTYDLAENLKNNYYDSDCHNDYYGNYTNYNKYFVTIHDILNIASDELSDSYKEKILEISDKVEHVILNENDKENKFKTLQHLIKQVNDFNGTTKIEEDNLKKKIERTKKEIVSLNKQLENFQKKKENELKSINKKVSELTNELGNDYINSKNTVKRRF